ncbi:MAG TPA: ATP-binding protein [Solirubrobacteraceae bacterium]
MADIPHVRLNLSNRPENVLLVRQTLSGLAETIELDPIELNDISTAVSEACNNVVLHAYEGAKGPLDVEVCAGSEGLEVVVRDHGGGIRPRLEPRDENAPGGIGLPVIHALSTRVEFLEPPGGGTEVRMVFATPAGADLGPAPEELELQAAVPDTEPEELADLMAITIGPGSVAHAVLPRVLCALAARAYFSTDRISDTQLLADALVAHAEGSIDTSRLNVGIRVAPRVLEMNVGPLRAGSAADGLGAVLETLGDGHEVSHAGASEILALHLAARR